MEIISSEADILQAAIFRSLSKDLVFNPALSSNAVFMCRREVTARQRPFRIFGEPLECCKRALIANICEFGAPVACNGKCHYSRGYCDRAEIKVPAVATGMASACFGVTLILI